MKRFLFIALALAVISAVITVGSQANVALTGDYVEARTASVFAGACHFNGEVVTTGRDAVMAWNVKQGNWKGTDLAGLRAVAVVAATDNLAQQQAARRSEIVVDGAVSDAQATALVEALQTKYAGSLGKIVSVRRGDVAFRSQDKVYAVDAPGFASLAVRAMPNDECCKMPNLVWYAPLVQLTHRKVGYTARASYAGGTVGEAWHRTGENSAFYGSFSL